MQNLRRSENLKKILMALIILALFGVSYYYYADKEKQTIQVKKPAKIVKNVDKKVRKVQKADKKEEKTDIKETKTEQKVDIKDTKTDVKEAKADIKEVKPEPKQVNNKIKPTDINDLIANAAGISGKSDPFSFAESRFMPFRGASADAGRQKTGNLPVPPTSSDYSPGQPAEPIVIKGFMGNKVIAEIKGYTESLALNESLKGIKVLKIDPTNLTCDFEIDGQKVTKTMKPITRPNNNIEINHIHN